MKIKLKYPWFGPNASYYGVGIHDVPTDWYELLPSTAELVDTVPTSMSPEPVQSHSLKDFDMLRADSVDEAAFVNKKRK